MLERFRYSIAWSEECGFRNPVSSLAEVLGLRALRVAGCWLRQE